jgi:Sema domain
MKSVSPFGCVPKGGNNPELFVLQLSTESSSDLVEGAYGNTNSRLIYGVFSTPNNAIAGSAICAFSLQVKHKVYFSISTTRHDPMLNFL